MVVFDVLESDCPLAQKDGPGVKVRNTSYPLAMVLQQGRSVPTRGFRIYFRIMLRITRSAMDGCETDIKQIIVIAA